MKDKIILQKIKNYIEKVNIAYLKIENMQEDDLLNIETSYALTQYLTNIHSLFQNISNDEVSTTLYQMGIRPLSTCRNISSHDYDSLDWVRVKQLCRKLLSSNTAELLDACLGIIEDDEKKEKDYTLPERRQT